MVAGMTRRLVLSAAVGFVAGGPLLAPSIAYAAGPDAVQISSTVLAAPLMIQPSANAELFAAVLGQVSWMANRPGEARAPAADKLGPKYTVVVLVKGVPKQTYDLYPLASGGPKAFRPAKQPDKRKVAAGWFYGRLNMPEVLRTAGAPLPAPPGARGGTGGGRPGEAFEPSTDIEGIFGEWRHVILLNGGVVMIIAIGLASFSFLVRRKV